MAKVVRERKQRRQFSGGEKERKTNAASYHKNGSVRRGGTKNDPVPLGFMSRTLKNGKRRPHKERDRLTDRQTPADDQATPEHVKTHTHNDAKWHGTQTHTH